MYGINEKAAVNLGCKLSEFYEKWAAVYQKGLEIEQEIKKLEAEKSDFRDFAKYPRDVASVIGAAKERAARAKIERENAFLEALRKYQRGEVASLDGLTELQACPTSTGMTVFTGFLHKNSHEESLFADENFLSIASGKLDKGFTEEQRQKAIAAIEQQIAKKQGELEKCWPDCRKYFNSYGKPEGNRDRWKEFVELWQHIAKAYCVPTDHEGFPLSPGSPAWQAFKLLGLKAIGATDPGKNLCRQPRREEKTARGTRWQ